MEAVVDLQADVQTVLERGSHQQAASRTDDIDDTHRYPRRKTPKTKRTAKRELNLKVDGYLFPTVRLLKIFL